MSEPSRCPNTEILQRFLHGQLPAAEQAAVNGHTARCRKCLDQLLRLKSQQRADAETLLPGPETMPPAAEMVTVRQKAYEFLADPQQADEVGRLAHYRILQVLGAGGMGVVFLAEDIHLQRRVALKAMLPDAADNSALRARFLREARATAAIEHEHIVAIHQVGPEGQVPYLAMQLLQGENLETRMRRENRMPVPEVLRIGREVAEGLAAAHARGLIHRDIKPSNIWLEAGSGRVKIVDFGLAKDVRDDVRLTQTGAILGTPWYMAPEQAGGEAVDARCDLFALGCVLYRLATGRMPFHGADALSVLVSVATDHPPAPDRVVRGLPGGLSKLIEQLLAKNPNDRPASASAVAEALGRLERAAAAPPKPPAPVMVPEPTTIILPPPRPPRSRRRLAWAAAVGLLVLAGVLGAVSLLGFRGQRSEPIPVAPVEPASTDKTPPVPIKTVALSGPSLVTQPAPLPGVLGWTLETRGHRGPIRTLAYSPDGQRLASGGSDATIRLWNARTGELERILVGHGNELLSVAWSSDGQQLFSNGRDGRVRLWNAQTGRQLASWRPEHRLVAFAPDGRTAANPGANHAVQLLEAATGKVVRTLEGPTAAVHALAWSPGGQWLAAGGDDQVVRVWSVTSAGPARAFKGHTKALVSLAWSSDARLLASASHDGSVRVWDTNKGTSIYTGPWTIADTPADSLLERFALAWSPREPLLAIGDEQKTQLWKPGNSQPVQTHSDWQGHIVAWSGDGATLAGAGPAAGAWRCDPVSGKRLTSLPGQPQLRPVAIYWSPDGKYLVLRGDLTLWVWDATAGTLYRTLPRSARQFRDIAWSPDSRRLAYRLVDGRTVYVWDLAANKVQNGYTAKENLTALAWSPDAKRLALGTAKPGAIFLWTVGADKQATTLQSPEGSPVSALAWSPDGTALASADAVVRIWNVAAKKVVQTLRPSGTTAVVAWSPTGRYVATGGTENGALRLWDPKTEKPLHELKGLVGSARELLWMADGKTLAARGSDRALRLWDADSGALLRTLNPPTPGRNYLPEHGLLSASSPSYTLRCRELGTGRPYATFAFFHPSEPAAYLTVTAEGHYQAPAALEGELVYVAATEAGMDVLKPDAFAAKYQWKNDRGAVRFAPVGSVRKE